MTYNNKTIPDEIGPYILQQTIGKGGYSVVKQAMHSETKTLYACKIVSRLTLNSDEKMRNFEMEIRILHQMKHPNIVQLFDLMKDENNFYVFLELCPNGDLFQYIVNQKFLREADAKILYHQFMEALHYVHSSGAVHLDLKPENLLVTTDGQIKMSDFGFSRFVWNKKIDVRCGSPCYVSPEIINSAPVDGPKSDIWSAGVILYAMVTGQLPWTAKHKGEIYEQIKKCDYKVPDYISQNCKDLIEKMMNIDPDQRPTCSEVLDHPWMKDSSSYIEDLTHICPVSLRQIDIFFGCEIDFIAEFGVPINVFIEKIDKKFEKLHHSFEFTNEDKLAHYIVITQIISKLPSLGSARAGIPSALEMAKRSRIRRLERTNRRSFDIKPKHIPVSQFSPKTNSPSNQIFRSFSFKRK